MKSKGLLSGFSLIEILVAAALLGLMGSLLLGTLTSALNIKSEVEKDSKRNQEISQAMSRMAREISMAFISAQYPPGASAPAQFNGSPHELSFTAFGHMVFKKNAKQSDQQTIKFALGNDERTQTRSLLRTIQPNIDLKFSHALTQTLCREIKDINFSYFDDKKGIFKSSWDTEGVENAQSLPSRVRIKMTAIIEGETHQDFYTEAFIWLTTPIRLMR